jgi:hypothetical protein
VTTEPETGPPGSRQLADLSDELDTVRQDLADAQEELGVTDADRADLWAKIDTLLWLHAEKVAELSGAHLSLDVGAGRLNEARAERVALQARLDTVDAMWLQCRQDYYRLVHAIGCIEDDTVDEVLAEGTRLFDELAVYQRDVVTSWKPRLDTAESRIDAALALHSEFRIYGECDHQHNEDDPGVKSIENVGLTCEDGYEYSICRECCTSGSGYQSEDCAEHDRVFCWPCETSAALKGETQP